MTQDEIILRHRINLLLLAKSIKNISAACRMFGRSQEELVKVGRNGVIDAEDPRLAAALVERTFTGLFKGELGELRFSFCVFRFSFSRNILILAFSFQPKTKNEKPKTASKAAWPDFWEASYGATRRPASTADLCPVPPG